MKQTAAALATIDTASQLFGLIYYQNSLGEDIMVVPCKTPEEYEQGKVDAFKWMEEQICMVSVRGVPSFVDCTIDGEMDAVESAGGIL